MKDFAKYAIVLAGGKGERAGGNVPKQFALLAGKPVLMHSIAAFATIGGNMKIILVMNTAWMRHWEELCREHDFKVPHLITSGGPQRFHSVKNGLSLIDNDQSITAVHDGVRPLADKALISRAYAGAAMYGNAIPVVPVIDSIRRKSGGLSSAVNRHELVMVQTPQCFRTSLLKKAYLQPYRDDFTDDASVAEADGVQIRLIEGCPYNIKITLQPDLAVASALLQQQ